MKTSELTGHALDWAVAMAENWAGADFEVKPYSTDWAQGGPIIEREKTALRAYDHETDKWSAEPSIDTVQIRLSSFSTGPTPLIAAMRCYVTSKLGDNIDIPKELT
jgi:hypothetical protein